MSTINTVQKWDGTQIVDSQITDDGTAVTVGGPTDLAIKNYIKSGLPAVGSAGRLARLSDNVRGLWMDGGSQWFPIGGTVLNIQEFGAVPDSVTAGNTNRMQIQACLDAVPETGGCVYIPAGQFYVNAIANARTFLIKDKTVIFGDGYNSQIYQNNAFVFAEVQPLFGFSEPPTHLTYFAAMNFRIAQNAAAANYEPASGNAAIQYSPASPYGAALIMNMWIEGYCGDGLNLNCKTLDVQSSVIDGVNGHCMYSGPSNGRIIGNVFRNWGYLYGSTVAGLKLQGPSVNLKIIGNSFEYTRVPTGSANCQGILIQGVTSNVFQVHDLVIEGNSFSGLNGNAINIAPACEFIAIIGNSFIQAPGNQQSGVRSTCGGQTVKGNIFDMANLNVAGYDGAVVSGSTTFMSAGAAFVSSLSGKTIVIRGAGVAGTDLTTRVTYVNAMQLTLQTAASTTVSDAKYSVSLAKLQGNDGAVASGTTTFTSAGATFDSSLVGKTIRIRGAGALNSVLTTTVAAYVSATTLTLQDPAGQSVSNTYFEIDIGVGANAIEMIGASGLEPANLIEGNVINTRFGFAISTTNDHDVIRGNTIIGYLINAGDGAISATSTTFTSNSALFTSALSGKTIVVRGAGASGKDLTTTIAAVNANGTTLTLSDAAQTGVTNAQYFINPATTWGIQAGASGRSVSDVIVADNRLLNLDPVYRYNFTVGSGKPCSLYFEDSTLNVIQCSGAGPYYPELFDGLVIKATINANCTFSQPGHQSQFVGRRLTFIIAHGPGGPWTVTFDANFRTNWSNLNAAPDKVSTISFVFDSTTTKWIQDGPQLGYF